MGMTKIRWSRMGKEKEDIKLHRDLKEVEEEEEIEKEVFLNKRIFNPDLNRVDMGFMRSTNMKTSRRIFFPPARPMKEEIVLEVRKEMWSSLVKQYIQENCGPQGKQNTDQLTKSQIRGKIKLVTRVRKGEIHISPSDKGNGLVVMPMDMYRKLVTSHTQKDQEVNWQDLEEAQKLIRSHARSLGKIFNLGTNEGDNNRERCHQNLSSWACDPPVLRAVAKTHKATHPQDVPKSRTIVGAARGLTTPLGE